MTDYKYTYEIGGKILARSLNRAHTLTDDRCDRRADITGMCQHRIEMYRVQEHDYILWLRADEVSRFVGNLA